MSDTKVKPPNKMLMIEFFVGLFFLGGLACLSYLSLNLAGMKISHHGYYQIFAEFNSIAGLKLGAPVEIAGVRIGEVSDVVLKDTSALVTLQVEDGIFLREDDIAAIRTKGIIGDRYIKISPGGSEDKVKAGGEIFDTESAMEFEEIIGKMIHRMDAE